MTARHTATISLELELQLVVPGGGGLAVDALRTNPTTPPYPVDASTDPYAVQIGFRTGDEDVVEWTFARQLLTDGVSRAVGAGDVQVWPAISPDRAELRLVCISLSSPSGTALFEAPRARLVEFLTQTYTAVPTGSESEYVDIDVELALLRWSGTGE